MTLQLALLSVDWNPALLQLHPAAEVQWPTGTLPTVPGFSGFVS